MTAAAPRLPRETLELVERLDDDRLPLAEVARRVCARVELLGYARPSYQQLRVLIHSAREERARRLRTREVLVDVALRVRPPEAVADHLSGVGVPRHSRSRREGAK